MEIKVLAARLCATRIHSCESGTDFPASQSVGSLSHANESENSRHNRGARPGKLQRSAKPAAQLLGIIYMSKREKQLRVSSREAGFASMSKEEGAVVVNECAQQRCSIHQIRSGQTARRLRVAMPTI